MAAPAEGPHVLFVSRETAPPVSRETQPGGQHGAHHFHSQPKRRRRQDDHRHQPFRCTGLLVDCDPQANSTSGIGIAQEDLHHDLYSTFYTPENIHESISSTRTPFLDVLPASTNLVAVELELVDKMAREFYLRDCLEPLGAEYDYIIIDCPPSLGLLTLNALCASQELLIPLQCEFFALEGIVKLLQTFELVKKRLNPGLNLLGVVLTMYDARNRLTREVRDEVQRCFPDHLFGTVVPRNVRLSEAPSHGKSIIHYDIKSKGADAYLNLAKEVALRDPARMPQPR